MCNITRKESFHPQPCRARSPADVHMQPSEHQNTLWKTTAGGKSEVCHSWRSPGEGKLEGFVVKHCKACLDHLVTAHVHGENGERKAVGWYKCYSQEFFHIFLAEP